MGGLEGIGTVWKFFIVFGCLIVLTMLAGFCKVLYNRRQLKKHIAAKETKSKEDVELALNDRQMDEGDLFGVRALEAGYFGGVAQSRPTSPAGSSRLHSSSTNTLVGSAAAPTPKLISPATSVVHLPRARTPSDASSPLRRNPPMVLKLEPSQAELNGRKNHGAVEVTVEAPQSPDSPRAPRFQGLETDSVPQSPAITISEYDAPPSPELLRPSVYNPNAPQLPVVESVSRISWRPNGIDIMAANAISIAASLDYTMGAPSNNSNPPSPRSESPLPSPVRIRAESYIPRRSRDEPRTIFPAEPRAERSRKSSISSVLSRRAMAEAEADGDVPAVPSLDPTSDFYILQPTVYTPTIRSRDDVSVSESNYSTNSRPRSSSVSSAETFPYETIEVDEITDVSKVGLSRSDSAASRRHSFGNNSLMPPPSPNPSSKDRFSDFFDAYYRHSQSLTGPELSNELARMDTLAVPRHSTIVEVPTPMASPMMSDRHA